MILLGRKQWSLSVCTGLRPGSTVLPTPQRKVALRGIETTQILCSPCLVYDAMTNTAAGTSFAADQFTVVRLPLALGFSLGQQNCIVKMQWVSQKSYFCLCILCAYTHICISTHIISIPPGSAMHIYWNACSFPADIALCLYKWKRILRIQMVIMLITATTLHS